MSSRVPFSMRRPRGPKPRFSVEELIRHGTLGPIRIGATRREIGTQLGMPDYSCGAYRSCNRYTSDYCGYGGQVEILWDNITGTRKDRVWYFSYRPFLPWKTTAFSLNRWLLRPEKTTLSETMSRFEKDRISFMQFSVRLAPEYTVLVTSLSPLVYVYFEKAERARTWKDATFQTVYTHPPNVWDFSTQVGERLDDRRVLN